MRFKVLQKTKLESLKLKGSKFATNSAGYFSCFHSTYCWIAV